MLLSKIQHFITNWNNIPVDTGDFHEKQKAEKPFVVLPLFVFCNLKIDLFYLYPKLLSLSSSALAALYLGSELRYLLKS